MALNLNKGGEESSKPTGEKKGLNLNKSGDNIIANSNLTKEKVGTNDTSTNLDLEKKKSPILYIVAAAILLGIGVYWFSNQNGNSENSPATSTIDNTTAIDTTVAQQVEQSQSSTETSDKKAENVKPAASAESNEAQSTSSSNASNAQTSTNNLANNAQVGSKTPPSSDPVNQLQGSVEEKATMAIRGDFGNGADRKKALGAEYAEVQEKVNELLRAISQ
jgi:cytoskeletal protein RodZ